MAGSFLNRIIIINIKSKSMPIVKANEPLGPRPVIITIYGDPGIGKTSLINTAKKPLIIDGDRGVSRAILRKDALIIDRWEEVQDLEKQGAFKPFSTIGIDTPKAILDDYMMSYVMRQDAKLRGNKLWAYGAIGDEYRLFMNNRRQDLADLINICHAKKDDDTKRMVPDVTGQTYQLILRTSDMIGYYTIHNGKRMLYFDPTESTVGKNVACLPPIEVPDKTDPTFRTFLADIIERVRTAIASQSEEQLEAMQKSENYQNEIRDCETPDQLTKLLVEVNALPDWLKIPLRKLITDKAKEKGYVPNKQTLCFEIPAGQPAANEASGVPAAATDQGAKPASPAPVKPATPPVDPKEDPTGIVTSSNDRYAAFGGLGMALEMDRVTGFGIFFEYEDINEWTEEQYMAELAKAHDAKTESEKKPKRKKATAAAAH